MYLVWKCLFTTLWGVLGVKWKKMKNGIIWNSLTNHIKSVLQFSVWMTAKFCATKMVKKWKLCSSDISSIHVNSPNGVIVLNLGIGVISLLSTSDSVRGLWSSDNFKSAIVGWQELVTLSAVLTLLCYTVCQCATLVNLMHCWVCQVQFIIVHMVVLNCEKIQ